MYRILAINPGSTSTKIGIYENEYPVFVENTQHIATELQYYSEITDQFSMRLKLVHAFIKAHCSCLDAVVGRGGILPPVESGTYRVTQKMLNYLRYDVEREHASNLGALLAHHVAKTKNIPAFIVDPVSVDEMDDVARYTGLPEIERKSWSHALNLKAMSRKAAEAIGIDYNALNLVVAHLGGGISVTAHRQGKMVDNNQALDGDGPFSPERSGGLPVGDLLRLAYSGKYTYDQLYKKCVGQGGLVAHLGTNDIRVVEERISTCHKEAFAVYEAMVYQIAKEIGAMAVVLCGSVDAIILTGGMAYSKMLTNMLCKQIEWIAPIIVYPGEDELLSMVQGVTRVFSGEEKAKDF